MSIFVYLIFLSFNEFVNVEKHARSRVVFFIYSYKAVGRANETRLDGKKKKLFTLKRVHLICLPFVTETYTHMFSLLPEINLLLIIASTYSHSMLFFLSLISFGLSHWWTFSTSSRTHFSTKTTTTSITTEISTWQKKSTRTTWKKNRTPISFQLLSPSFLRHHRLRFRKSRWVIHQHLRIMNTNPNDVPVSFDSAIVVDKCSFPINQIIF